MVARVLAESWKRIAIVAGSVLGLVALAAGIYFLFGQPVRRVWTLSFRVTFEGAAEGKYPNELAFGTGDIISTSVVQRVFDGHRLEEFCSFDSFRGGLVVERGAGDRRVLDSQYSALLSNTRLTPVERQQLEEEYRARSEALPLEFRVVFVKSRECGAIPSEVVGAALSAILESWAVEAESKRGVLKYQVSMLGPGIFDQTNPSLPVLVKLDLARTALRRALAVVDEIAKLPGSQSVQTGPDGMTLAEIRGRLTDLKVRSLQPLFIEAGSKGVGPQSLAWLEEARSTARLQKEAAEQRTENYRSALREFSGSQPTPSAVGRGSGTSDPQPGPEGQPLVPQIDSTFIERIVQLSSENSAFRQELTREMVAAGEEAVTAGMEESYYDVVLRSGFGAEGGNLDSSFEWVLTEGRRLVSQLNTLYEQLSRVGLHPGAAMYITNDLPRENVLRPFTFSDYILLLGMTAVVALVVAALLVLFRAARQSSAWDRSAEEGRGLEADVKEARNSPAEVDRV